VIFIYREIMNFDYSYRAFIITCLLFGILFLSFKSITLSKYTIEIEDDYDLQYIENPIMPQEDLASISEREVTIETNRAFNEAEKFISEIEKENDAFTEKFDEMDKLSESNMEDTNSLNYGTGNSLREKKPSEKQKNHSDKIEVRKTVAENNVSKRNSTVSYSLVKRVSLNLPNPVYTCYNYGKVVINIEVNEKGDVTKTMYNATASSTTNECLIDSALDYAKRAKFTTATNKATQQGSITYNFQGQQ